MRPLLSLRPDAPTARNSASVGRDSEVPRLNKRAWQNGHAPAFQVGNAGSIPVVRSNKKDRVMRVPNTTIPLTRCPLV